MNDEVSPRRSVSKQDLVAILLMAERITDGIIKRSIHDVLRDLDDIVDYRNMSRAEALKLLREMELEVEVRIDWVREALRAELHDDYPDHRRK
jgi:hypothetical protein